MAAISISIQRGSAGQKFTDYTTGTLAPNGSADIELRVQVLDGQSNPITRKDVILALDMFARQIEAGKVGAFGNYVLAP
jgi:hypothetical protein